MQNESEDTYSGNGFEGQMEPADPMPELAQCFLTKFNTIHLKAFLSLDTCAFPTPVGMNRFIRILKSSPGCVPHTRGEE
jgi:hypothetical protein